MISHTHSSTSLKRRQRAMFEDLGARYCTQSFNSFAWLVVSMVAVAACGAPQKDTAAPTTNSGASTPVTSDTASITTTTLITDTSTGQPPSPPPACSALPASTQGPDDGRFTLGVEAQRLMYGYPIPYSTSHFVLAVDDRYATNNPGRFRSMNGHDVTPGSPSGTTHIRGVMQTSGAAAQRTEIKYQFGGVTLTQRLIPVDGNFVETVKPPSHYRIEYELQNGCGSKVMAGLLVQIDTMIGDNDACQMRTGLDAADAVERGFSGAEVPNELFAYHDIRNDDDLIGIFSLAKGEAVKPDELYIGPWPKFYHALWDVAVSSGASYGDSAVIFKWNNRQLEPGETRRVATHYGMKKGVLNLLHSTNALEERIDIYFAINSAYITMPLEKQLDQFVNDKVQAVGMDRIIGVIVEGRADAVYEDDYNMRLSRHRAEVLRDYMRRRTGHGAVKIITKAFGEAQADQSAPAQSSGRLEDRRGTIILYRKP